MKILALILILFGQLAWAQRDFPFANGTLRVPELGSRSSLDCVGCQRSFPHFVIAKFNHPGDFHGPNCYNTALIASGAFELNQIRYVSPEEFEALITQLYSPLSQATAGSLVVMDAKASRGHAALYLGDGLIFHKKSFGTQYHYRIAPLSEAGIVEKNEWVPSPMEGSHNQFLWPELGKLPVAFYRLNKKSISLESNFAKVLRNLESLLVADLGRWAIAKNWGLIGTKMVEDYLEIVKPKSTALTKGMLISFKDQMNLYFEEVHYKNSRSYDRTTSEICVPENTAQVQKVFFEIGISLKMTSDELQTRWNKLITQDKKRCSLRPLR